MSKEPKYVKNTLGKGEEIKWVAELNWIVWVGPILWFIIGLLFCAAPNIILLLIFCDSYLIIIVRKFISKDDIDGYLYGDARSMFGKQSCV